MRRWIAPPLVLAAAAALAVLRDDSPARAQGGSPENVVTADGVQLHGEFHKAEKGGGNSPVVVLLYPPGVDRTMDKGDWKGLAVELTKQGYHVFRFDWRGHGKSTNLKGNTFWQNNWTGPYNRKLIRGAAKMPQVIHVKDFSTAYFPLYANDLAAVRTHLDQKNDLGELNTSSIYLIGAEDAAALGFLWLVAEWSRPAVYNAQPLVEGYSVLPDPRFPSVRDDVNRAAGKDYAGCVWLSAARPNAISGGLAREWTKSYATSLRENNPMLFLYGDKDQAGKRLADELFKEVLVAAPPKGSAVKPLPLTFMRQVDGAGALKGAGLLGNNVKLKTEDTIGKYLVELQKDRAQVARKPRNYTAPYYVDLRAFGVNLPAP